MRVAVTVISSVCVTWASKVIRMQVGSPAATETGISFEAKPKRSNRIFILPGVT